MKIKGAMEIQAFGTAEGVEKEWDTRRSGGIGDTNPQPHPESGQFQKLGTQQSPIGTHTFYGTPAGSQVAVTQMPNNTAMVHEGANLTQQPQVPTNKILQVKAPSQSGGKLPNVGKGGGGAKLGTAGKGVTHSFLGSHKATGQFLQKKFGIQHTGFRSAGKAQSKVPTTGNTNYKPGGKATPGRVPGQRRGGYAVPRFALFQSPTVSYKK